MKLAEMLSTSTSYIGEIEINRKAPSMEMVKKIADALNIEPFWLFFDSAIRVEASDGIPPIPEYLERLNARERQDLLNHITGLFSNGIHRFLQLEPSPKGPQTG